MEKTMKLKKQSLLWLTILGGVLAILATATIPVMADGDASPAFDVQASLVTPARVTLGEPILVRYGIRNVSGQVATAHLGMAGSDWYTFVLRDSDGRVVPTAQGSRSSHPVDAFWTMNTFAPGEDDNDEYIAVSQFKAVQRPGKYTLTFHVDLKYSFITDAQTGSLGVVTRASCLTQTQDIILPILVTAPDANRLRATAEVFQKAVSDTEVPGRLQRADMDALFSMPEAQVSAMWRDLAIKPSMKNDLVASELEGLQTKTGVDILVEMLDVPKLRCTSIDARISRVYNAADPALRDHIKAIAKERGFEMPDAASVPVRLD